MYYDIVVAMILEKVSQTNKNPEMLKYIADLVKQNWEYGIDPAYLFNLGMVAAQNAMQQR